MNIIRAQQLPSRLTVVLVLARLLERLERDPRGVSPDPYREVVGRLQQALESVPADAALQALLGAFPAAAELYENLNYRHAGLCLSPLDVSLGAEMAARDLIQRAAKGSASA